jgi:hypothetical protein
MEGAVAEPLTEEQEREFMDAVTDLAHGWSDAYERYFPTEEAKREAEYFFWAGWNAALKREKR